MKINSLYLALSLLLCLFISCKHDNKVVFDEYQPTKGTWEKNDVKTFVWDVQDTLTPHNLFMNVRVNNDYPYSNMFVVFKIYKPSAAIVIDTIQFQMADPNGALLGSGFSDVKESKLWLKQNYTFDETGKYKLTLEQAVRALGDVEGVPALQGVSEVGFRIEKAE
ncbi:gliding motility lipoprotein GldH [Myroides sp. 1354]|uniref:gliding motility lipoprotein GldH n=1 Tax=unclassified Myroides TaxID=2642485 RepID=UPI0025755A56|nr:MULTISPECIES: gliding motility lipoprotein GldH [unclassified Myroides]MDM1043557.1 gliding motility lipoprotein GldH [Myroides sp. R163-1]MDM1054393.1 gliding motility lipoprotein GldH [Myroides sp. 1354]MDM1067689.1 gliding motility lipoprotein GldH [Myroides sp. 1372]